MVSQKANSNDRPFRIGLLHYSCPPLVGGVEEIVSQHAHILNRMGHSISVLAGMGEVYTDAFPVRIEPVIGSKDPQVSKAHVQSRKGNNSPLRDLTNRILTLLIDWSHDFDVVLAHNVLQLPFNLPLTLALRRQASSRLGPVLVSWAHDSPYFEQHCPRFLNHSPWDVLRRPHPGIHYVTISKCRKELFQEQDTNVKWKVINNGIDPVTFFYLDEKSVKLASELDLFSRDLVVVQPSRVTPRKNLELSIHIIRGIKNLGYNVIFILTGAYDPHEARAVSYYRRLRYWIDELDLKDNIAVLAEYRFKDGTKLVPDRIFIRDLYLMADLLLMTSKDEGFGLPLLEAGMIKLPIACTEIPPFIEVGRDVCFFRPSDPPLFIAGRIIEYLSRTTTHTMFRKVMKEYILCKVCKNDLLPYLFEITDRTAAKV